MAKLSSEQQKQVEAWAAGGATLNDIQSRLKSEFGITLTYLDARMLLIDLGVKLIEKPRPVEKAAEVLAPSQERESAPDVGLGGGGRVSVSADEVAIPGAMVSGKAVFSDGKTVAWFVDGNGRLGLNAPEPGYRPPPDDIPVFEQQLDALLARM